VPVLAAVAYLCLVFKDNYLIAPAVFPGRGQYPGSINERLADSYIIAVGQQQYLVQLDGAALGYPKTLDIDSLAFGYLILLATGFNYSVNIKPPN